jgi:hypothetical protein
MTKNLKPPVTDFFWKLAAPLPSSGQASEGALLGFPCLRVEEQFFATCDHRTGELTVKLPRERVQELIDGGSAIRSPRPVESSVGGHWFRSATSSGGLG